MRLDREWLVRLRLLEECWVNEWLVKEWLVRLRLDREQLVRERLNQERLVRERLIREWLVLVGLRLDRDWLSDEKSASSFLTGSACGGLGECSGNSSTGDGREPDSEDCVCRGRLAPSGSRAKIAAAVGEIFSHHESNVSAEFPHASVNRSAGVARNVQVTTVRPHSLVSHGHHFDGERST